MQARRKQPGVIQSVCRLKSWEQSYKVQGSEVTDLLVHTEALLSVQDVLDWMVSTMWIRRSLWLSVTL